ncbi:MAG TPA: hypothetical protein VFP69_11890 [Streptomyces sp.]|nr:hypothetical protein [Streptomyces sp.]
MPVPPAAPAPSPPALPEAGIWVHTALTTSVASGADAPGPRGPMLVDFWPAGAAYAYAWETRDRRWCSASIRAGRYILSGCTLAPTAVGDSRGVHWLDVLFTRGVVYLFGVDNQQVNSVTFGGKPLKARRVGTVAHGARTLYAVRSADYVKGSVVFSLSHDGTTSEASVDLDGVDDGVGDRTCYAAP